MKDPQVEELKKPQEPKTSTLQRSENAETSEKAWKEKKNNCRHQCNHRAPKDGRLQKRSTPATGVNNTSIAGGGNSRRNQNRGARQDPAYTTHWNCNIKSHYAIKWPEPSKPINKYRSWQPPRWWLVLIKRLQKLFWIEYPTSTTRLNSAKIKRQLEP